MLNPSFEDTIQCVINHSQFKGYVSDWGGGFGEYFNSDCQGWQVEVPNNIWGHQVPRTGVAYAGIWCIVPDTVPSHENLRDYIEGKLSVPLVGGHTYCVNFYVNHPDSSKYVCPIGIRFTADTILFNQYCLPLSPDYVETSLVMLSDSINWTLVSFNFVAQGGERFFTIGNFWNDTITPIMVVNAAAPMNLQGAYFFIDDVSVVEYTEADADSGATICLADSVQLNCLARSGLSYTWAPGLSLSDSTSANPFAYPLQTTTYTLTIADTSGSYCLGALSDSVTIFVEDCSVPESFFIPTILTGDEIFAISGIPPNTIITLYDMRGRLIFRNENYQNDLNASSLAAGSYIYKLQFTDGAVQSGKVTVVH